MLVRGERRRHDRRVRVVGGGDDHRVELVRVLVERGAVVLDPERVGVGLGRLGHRLVVDIAEPDDVGAGVLVDLPAVVPADGAHDPDGQDAEARVAVGAARSERGGGGEGEPRGEARGGGQEVAAGGGGGVGGAGRHGIPFRPSRYTGGAGIVNRGLVVQKRAASGEQSVPGGYRVNAKPRLLLRRERVDQLYWQR
jgi:hypothetical protein